MGLTSDSRVRQGIGMPAVGGRAERSVQDFGAHHINYLSTEHGTPERSDDHDPKPIEEQARRWTEGPLAEAIAHFPERDELATVSGLPVERL